ncbi:MAG: hypothetical protein AB7P67_04650 [Vicinamibacterales bacterium]
MGRNVRAITLKEMTALLAAVSGRPVSDRQVRYLLIAGGVGGDTALRAHGRTRLYGSVDVALARAAVALRAEGVSPQLTRVVMTYLRDDLVRAWKAAAPVAIAVRGVQATLEPALKSPPARVSAWVPLRPIWQGLDARVQEVADARDDVWMYRRVKVGMVPRNTL